MSTRVVCCAGRGARLIGRGGSYFNRDVSSIRKFFRKRFRYESEEFPTWRTVLAEMAAVAGSSGAAVVEEKEGERERDENGKRRKRSKKEMLIEEARRGRWPRLDLLVEASGFGRGMQEELEEVSCVGTVPFVLRGTGDRCEQQLMGVWECVVNST